MEQASKDTLNGEEKNSVLMERLHRYKLSQSSDRKKNVGDDDGEQDDSIQVNTQHISGGASNDPAYTVNTMPSKSLDNTANELGDNVLRKFSSDGGIHSSNPKLVVTDDHGNITAKTPERIAATTDIPPEGTTIENHTERITTESSPEGTTTEYPTERTTTESPPAGTTIENPTEGTTTESPPAGTTIENPTEGTTTESPPAGTTIENPTEGTTTESPPAGTIENPTEGTTTESPPAGTTIENPTEGTTKSPPAGTIENPTEGTTTEGTTTEIAPERTTTKNPPEGITTETPPEGNPFDGATEGATINATATIYRFEMTSSLKENVIAYPPEEAAGEAAEGAAKGATTENLPEGTTEVATAAERATEAARIENSPERTFTAAFATEYPLRRTGQDNFIAANPSEKAVEGTAEGATTKNSPTERITVESCSSESTLN